MECWVADHEVELLYTNWKGETRWRHVVPEHIYFGATDYHPEPQWLLHAWDLDKHAVRDFAVKDIKAWKSKGT